MSRPVFSLRIPVPSIAQAAVSVLLAVGLCVWPGLSRGADTLGESPAPAWTEPVTGMEFALIPGGCFEMGRAPGVTEKLLEEVDQWFLDHHYADEEPRKEVCVDPFWLARREVSQGEWEKVTGDADKGCTQSGLGPDLPANFITYEEARDFAVKLSEMEQEHYEGNASSFRLPTEAEWEFACRAGQDTPYSTGWELTPDDARYRVSRKPGGGIQRTRTVAPVGSYPPNTYGVYGMHGNVEEWTASLYTPHPGEEPTFETRDSPRVVKGGSFLAPARNTRCGARKWAIGRHVSCQVGMRLVRNPPASQSPSQ